MRSHQRLQTPTFAQTVLIIRTMPATQQTDQEAIKLRHLALGFHYDNEMIYRALKALRDPARSWDHGNRRSGRST
jgi:hypothetical protein